MLVSNREPYIRPSGGLGGLGGDGGERPRLQRRTGGLVTALEPVMRSCKGVWVAWDTDGGPNSKVRTQVPDEPPQFTLSQVGLSDAEVRGYYHGFANRALWPLCHYFVDRCHFDAADWAAYSKVNARFADAAAAEARRDDLVWIHDYHFCLAPRLVRERRTLGGPIAFFLHIPFPAQEIFRVIPWRRELLTGLLGADLVGFHTNGYVANFLRACEQIVGADVDFATGEIRWQGRVVRAAAFPIGIDVAAFEQLATTEECKERCARIRSNIGGEKIVLGVDRLDYSKGIIERLHAIERLFDRHPAHRGKVTFVQIAVPSRGSVKDYADLKRRIDETVGRINGKLSDTGWSPILYIYRALTREDLVAYYRAADVALVTPLRDGMNLVAKEYCAAHTDEDGVLVLSEFAGAAERLSDAAIVVNPFGVDDVSAALDWALTMKTDERKRRMQLLRRGVAETDIHRWLDDILSAAMPATSIDAPTVAAS